MANGILTDTAEIFKQCYDEYYTCLMRFAQARLRENSSFAEDCVQDAFLVFYNRLQTGETFAQPRAFLYRALDNIVKKQQSKLSAEEKNTLSIDDPDNEVSLRAEETIDYEKYIRLLEQTLDANERYFYIEKYVKEKKIVEIAKACGLSVGAVTMRLSRLRKKLRKELEDLIC